MGLLSGVLRQKATYWAPTSGSYDKYGKQQRTTGVEIACRWEDVAEEFIQPDGTKAVSRSKVFMKEDLEVGGLLILLPLADTEDSSFPSDPREAGALNIRSVAKTPNLRASEFVRVVYL